MAPPRGNQFWKLRSKHGRDTLFASPDQLLTAAEEYFAWCDKQQWMRKEPIKSGSAQGTMLDVPMVRPYSVSGLCIYLGCSQSYFSKFKKHCSEPFLEVVERIENIIETQQFEGAVLGLFNGSIIARKLGLREQADMVQGVDSVLKIEVVGTAVKEELLKLKKKLES